MFSKNLKRLMAERDLNGKQLSVLSGVSQSGISQYLKGTNVPSTSIIEKLANALNVSIQMLIEDSDDDEKANTNISQMQKITVEMAAKMIGKSDEFVRIGLQQNRLPFGTAVNIRGKRWTYHISANLLQQYIGKAG